MFLTLLKDEVIKLPCALISQKNGIKFPQYNVHLGNTHLNITAKKATPPPKTTAYPSKTMHITTPQKQLGNASKSTRAIGVDWALTFVWSPNSPRQIPIWRSICRMQIRSLTHWGNIPQCTGPERAVLATRGCIHNIKQEVLMLSHSWYEPQAVPQI